MSGIGSTLRDARIRARIDITEVEARTKIRAKYLRAIENEEWDLLPGPVYIRSFLRTYGDFLGLDSRMLVEEFKRRYEEPAEHELHPIAPLHEEGGAERGPARHLSGPGRRLTGPGRRLTLPPWLAVGGVLVAVVVALFIIGNGSKTHNNSRQTGDRTDAQRHKRHRTAKHTVTTAPPAPTNVTLQLIPTAPVYVCLENGARKVLINGVTYTVGQAIPTEKAREFFLTLGNANVQMRVNGKPVAVSPSTTAIGLRILPQGPSPLLPGREPTCS